MDEQKRSVDGNSGVPSGTTPPDDGSLEPGGRWVDVANIVKNQIFLLSYHYRDMFGVVSVAVEFDAVAWAFAPEAADQIVGVVDGKHGV